ncbi:DeoR/GlpR transcriptional regulator [Klebsiella pneumoniae]|uniref:DeoR/GlpR transcriptional regulator n=1 Tax=Klebsiella pneumoniae TaxID=573 RepID=A0A927HU17_KLEPN|nr:DeoR/GlpR transcriptional regulator [Klebsiella pneumoniae]
MSSDGSSTSWFFGPADAGDGVDGDYALHSHLTNSDEPTLVASRRAGGDFSPTEESFFGKPPHERYANMPLIRSFFSCRGLERDSGLYAGTQAHAALLKQMLLGARQTVALVDGSKLGRTGVARIGGLGELDCLVTERFVDPLLEKEMTGITSACKSPEYAVMT